MRTRLTSSPASLKTINIGMRNPNVTTSKEVLNLLDELRRLAPKRPLTYGESLQVARLQAARLRQWSQADDPNINLRWLTKQRVIPVNFVPSFRLDQHSGLTTDLV